MTTEDLVDRMHGEAGWNPARSRHCEPGVACHGPLISNRDWEGGGQHDALDPEARISVFGLDVGLRLHIGKLLFAEKGGVFP